MTRPRPVTAATYGRQAVTPARMPASRQGERGGASLVALALAAFLLLAGLLAVDVGALAAARAAAQNAADLAALAALTPGDGPPSARATTIAAANGAELADCDCSAMQAVVTVRRRVVLAPTGLSVRVTARARAVLAPTGTGQALPAEEPASPSSSSAPGRVPGVARNRSISDSSVALPNTCGCIGSVSSFFRGRGLPVRPRVRTGALARFSQPRPGSRR